MTFRVAIGTRAKLDIDGALAWRARTSASAANRWGAGLFRTIQSLENDPVRHPIADEAADVGVELREVLYGKRRNVFRILFTIEGQTVNIVRVRHAAQERLSLDGL